MRTVPLFLAAVILGLTTTIFAQSTAKAVEPDAIVRRLYAEQKAGSGPVFQMKNRSVIDKYFSRDLADLIWKDAVAAKGEVGALGFDPLFGSQDPQITNFVIMETGWGGDEKFGRADLAVVQVTFKNSGKEEMVSFQFRQKKNKVWKVYDILYPDRTMLKAILSGEATASKPFPDSENFNGSGELQTGKTQSVILYVGEETGDYAAYCFANNSAAGRAILKVCKDGDQCGFTGKVDYIAGTCEVPGLEATLSSSGTILTIAAVKKLARRR